MSGIRQIMRTLAYGITCIKRNDVDFPAIAKAWREGSALNNTHIEIILEKLSKVAPLKHGHYSAITEIAGESDIWDEGVVSHYWLGVRGAEHREHTHNWGVLRKPANVMPQHLTLDWVLTGKVTASFDTDGREIFLINVLPVIAKNGKMFLGQPTQVRSVDELSLDKVSIGDWVVTHHGLIVEKTTEEVSQEANKYNEAILVLWNERG